MNHFIFTNTYKVGDREAIRVKELKHFLDFAIELMLKEDSDASIINYAIKVISKKHLGKNAKDYYIKQIHHLVLLYPYLINLLELKVFEAHDVDNEIIKTIAKDIYHYGLKKKIYEACSFAIYWSLKYDFSLEISSLKKESLDSEDCIFMMIAYLSDKKTFPKRYLKEYKDKAEYLRQNDFDRYWLYVYEVLTQNELQDNYKKMKKNKITFIRAEFLN